MPTQVEITGQTKPVEVEFEWKTARTLENISQAVTRIQTSVGDSWTGSSGTDGIDAEALASAISTAVAAAVKDAVADLQLSAASPAPAPDTPAGSSAPVQVNVDAAALEQALVNALKTAAESRRWNHSVVRTPNPPDETLLDRGGVRGFELINVIHDPETKQWTSYFKKLIK